MIHRKIRPRGNRHEETGGVHRHQRLPRHQQRPRRMRQRRERLGRGFFGPRVCREEADRWDGDRESDPRSDRIDRHGSAEGGQRPHPVLGTRPRPPPPAATGPNPPQRKVRFLPPSAFLSRREAAKLGMGRARRPSSPPGRYGALLMAGCQDTEYSYDAYFEGRPNGAFTFVALRALASLAAEATYGDWYKAIRRVLPSRQHPPTPHQPPST